MLPYHKEQATLLAEIATALANKKSLNDQIAAPVICLTVGEWHEDWDGQKIHFANTPETRQALELLIAGQAEHLNTLTKKAANLPMEWLVNEVRSRVDGVEPGLFNYITQTWKREKTDCDFYISFNAAHTHQGKALKERWWAYGGNPMALLEGLDKFIAKLPQEDVGVVDTPEKSLTLDESPFLELFIMAASAELS